MCGILAVLHARAEDAAVAAELQQVPHPLPRGGKSGSY